MNGILQHEGVDYEVEEGRLAFSRPLVQEGKLGVLRWTSMFLGIAGSYRKNDSIDVVYEAGGRRVVATGLKVIPSGSPPG